MSWKAEVISVCVCGTSRLRNDFAAREYNERRVASKPAVELELAPGLVSGPEAVVVVVEDMEGGGISHASRLTLIDVYPVPASETGSASLSGCPGYSRLV